MGGKTTTSTNTVKIPQEVLDRYNAVNAQAQQVAQNPFQKYGTQASDFVAQFNPQQNQGIAGINTVAGMGPAYNNVEKYLNPYIKNVADTTRAQMEQANEQAQSGALGTAVQSGAFGGDRAGVAAANLANQQNMAMGSTMAGIYNQGYGQAMDANMADLNRMAGLAGNQLAMGTQIQQTEQAGKDALINQFQQEQGFPFQVAQFLANIAMGTGALTGSTTTAVNQGSFFSDRRLKHDIKEIGKSHDGMPIYTFKYKGDPEQHTHVGFMADEVEKKHPEAVGLDPSGYKTVDYDKATHSMGGGVHERHAGEAFADGGVAGPYGSKVGQGVGAGSYIPEAYLPVGELMVADPTMAAQKTQGLADIMEAAANTGKSLTQLDESFGPDGKFWNMIDKKKAYGGGVQPEKHEDYLSSTLAAQDADKQKPQLQTAAPSQQQGSGIGDVASILGSVATLASLSDRRAKHDIKEIGKSHNGLPIYTFKYKGDDREQTHVGFMADEVEKKHPEAVGQRNGLKTVDYSQAHKFAAGGVAGDRHGYALNGAVSGAATNLLPSGVVPAADRIREPFSYSPKADWKMIATPEGGFEFDPNSQMIRNPLSQELISNRSSAERNPSGGITVIRDNAGDLARQSINTQLASDLNNTAVGPAVQNAVRGIDIAEEKALRENPNLKFQPERLAKILSEQQGALDAAFKQVSDIPRPLTGLSPDTTGGSILADKQKDFVLSNLQNTLAGGDVSMPVVSSQGLGGVDAANAYRDASARRFANEAPTAEQRPKPRPEGLGVAAVPVVNQGPVASPAAPSGVVPPASTRQIAKVLGSGYRYTDVEYSDGTRDRITGDRNFRNNNPGNLEYGDLAKKYGAVGTDGRFAVFPDYETGRKAKESLLFDSGNYDGMNIITAIKKYNPKGDGANNPEEYAKNVAAELGLPIDTPLASLNPQQRSAMLTAMERQEGSGGGTGSSEYSTTPIGANGAPLPPQGGVAGGFGANATRAPFGGVKPYEYRNTLGKIIYDENGKLDKNAMLSLFAGLGDMLSSPSPFLLPSIGAGISGAANTYMAREGQLANIAQTKAETDKTRVDTDVSRFFSAIPGLDGFPLVIIGPGKAVTLTEYLKNPATFTTGDPARDAAIQQEAQRISGSAAAPLGGGSQGAPKGVRWSAASDAAVQKAIEKLENRPGDFSSNDKESRLIMDGASQARTAALANKPNSNELAFTVASAIGDNNMGTAEGYFSNTILPSVNAALRSVDPSLAISDADDQQQVLRKLSRLNAANMTPEQQRAASVFQEFASVSPDLRMTPDAAATITSSIMLQDQDAIDRANFYSAFMSRAGSGVSMADVDVAYANEYSEMHQMEKDAMKQLLLLSNDPERGKTVRDLFSAINSGSANQEDAQAVLGYILGEETPPLLARWLVKGM